MLPAVKGIRDNVELYFIAPVKIRQAFCIVHLQKYSIIIFPALAK
jgi:uncharacterized membrane protein